MIGQLDYLADKAIVRPGRYDGEGNAHGLVVLTCPSPPSSLEAARAYYEQLERTFFCASPWAPTSLRVLAIVIDGGSGDGGSALVAAAAQRWVSRSPPAHELWLEGTAARVSGGAAEFVALRFTPAGEAHRLVVTPSPASRAARIVHLIAEFGDRQSFAAARHYLEAPWTDLLVAIGAASATLVADGWALAPVGVDRHLWARDLRPLFGDSPERAGAFASTALACADPRLVAAAPFPLGDAQDRLRHWFEVERPRLHRAGRPPRAWPNILADLLRRMHMHAPDEVAADPVTFTIACAGRPRDAFVAYQTFSTVANASIELIAFALGDRYLTPMDSVT